MSTTNKPNADESAGERQPIQAVAEPILCSPYREPTAHWSYGADTPMKVDGRRPAGFFTTKQKTGDTDSLDMFAEETMDTLPLVEALRGDVGQWRESGYRGASEVTKALLHHWKRNDAKRRLFFCQIEAVETLIYLLELRIPGRSSRTGFKNFQVSDVDIRAMLAGKRPAELKTAGADEHFPKLADQPSVDAWMPLRRLGCKMATGSGKTVVMSMMIAWAFCNRGRNPASTEFPNAVLVCAPNLTVKSRLQVLKPESASNYYDDFEIVPAKYREYLNKGRVLVVNWHVFHPKSKHSDGGETYQVVDKGGEDERAFTKARLGELAERMPILVLNDEGHHCWRPKPTTEGVTTHDTAESNDWFKEELEEARVWLNGLDRINNSGLAGKNPDGTPARGVLATIDLSATPFFLAGSGYPEGAPFPWLVSDFGLVDAIESGIVKIPRIPVTQMLPNTAPGEAGRPDPKYFKLWDHMVPNLQKDRLGKTGYKPEAVYREAQGALATLYAQWKLRFQHYLEAVVDPAKQVIPPAIIIVCPDTNTAEHFFRKISGERTEGEGKESRVVYDHSDYPELKNEPGLTRTFRIDSKLLSELSSDETATKNEKVQEARRLIDTIGRRGQPGEHIRCVVSVMFLTEGWDANNVTQILGVRPFRSQLLCEQVVGRGLRRRSYEVRTETLADGTKEERLEPEYVDVYGIPFSLIPFKGREGTVDDPADKPENRIRCLSERECYKLDIPNVKEYTFRIPKSNIQCNFDAIPKLLLHAEPISVDVKAVQGQVAGLAIASDAAAEVVRHDRAAFYEGVTLQSIAMEIAKDVTIKLLQGQPDQPKTETYPPAMHLFPRIFQYVNTYLATKVELRGDQHIFDIKLEKNKLRAVESIHAAILIAGTDQKEPDLLPILNEFRPKLKSADVSESTRRPIQMICKSHVNALAPRSEDETRVARFLDESVHVRRWLPNSRTFGFLLPYEHDGADRHYEPDYVIELDHDGTNSVYLILEVKGVKGEQWDEQSVRAKEMAARRYCTALNNAGAYGQWNYEIVREHDDLESILCKYSGKPRTREPFDEVHRDVFEGGTSAFPLIPLATVSAFLGKVRRKHSRDSDVRWIRWNGMPTSTEKMFVSKVVRSPMSTSIPLASWCLFRSSDAASAEGKIVIAEHPSFAEPGLATYQTIRRLRFVEVHDPATGAILHRKIVLESESQDDAPREFIDSDLASGQLRIEAELVAILREQ